MKRVVGFLQKNMIWETLIIIIISIFLGKDHHSFFVSLKPLLPFALFLMLYKPMTYLKFDAIFTEQLHIKKKYILTLTLLYCIIFPLSAYILMKTFLWILPDFNKKWIAGLVILALAPIASSAPAFVEICGGDTHLALIGVIFTFFLSLFVVPLASKMILSEVVTVSISSLLKALAVCIGIPLIAGQATRYLIIKLQGRNTLIKIKPFFDILVLVGLFMMVFIVFGINSKIILKQPHTILCGIVLVNIYFTFRWFLTLILGRILKFPLKQNIALVYSSTYNMTIATAISIATFGPSSAVGTIIGGPFAEMIQMILLVRFFKYLMK